MDDKTRSNFDLNIWNHQTMTENRIYETCDDVLGTENHYCTPVPSRDSGISSVQSTSALTSGFPKRAFQRRGISGKSVGILLTSGLAILLVAVLIVCSAFALSELQRLQVEMGNLREELASLRDYSSYEVGNLTLAITQERESREEGLNNFGDIVDSTLVALSESTKVNISILESGLRSDLNVLTEVLSANLSVVANLTSAYHMDLTLALNDSFSTLSQDFAQFQSDYWNNYQTTQNITDLHTREIDAANASLYTLRDLVEESQQNLSSTLSYNIESVRQEVGVVDSRLQETIGDVHNRTLAEVSKLQSEHVLDVDRIDRTLAQNVETLTNRIQENENYIVSNTSALQDYVNAKFLEVQNTMNASRSSLVSEITRVERQLTAASHSNFTFLSSDFETRIEALENEVRDNLTHLERTAEENITISSTRSMMELTKLERDTRTNLTELVKTTQNDISDALNHSFTLISNLEASVLTNLSALSVHISAAEQEFEKEINSSLETLKNRTAQSKLELSNEISILQGEIRMNVTSLQVMIGDVHTNILAELSETKQTLVAETTSNITRIQAITNLRLQDIESTFWRNISVLETELQSMLKIVATNTSLELGLVRSDLNLGIATVSQSAALNISALEQIMTGMLDELRLQTQRNLSSSGMRFAWELSNTTLVLQYSLDSLWNVTEANVHELQRVDNRTLESIQELELIVARNITHIHNNFEEALASVSSDIHLELSALNQTDSALTNILQERGLDIKNIIIHNNNTRIITAAIEEDIEHLAKRTAANQVNISVLSAGLNAVELSLNDLEITLNDSFSELHAEIKNVSRESNQSFSELHSSTRAINGRLNLSISEAKSDVADLELRVNESITSLESRTNLTVQLLAQNIHDDIIGLQSETYFNISKLDNDATTLFLQVNTSLISKLEEASHQNRHKFTLLTERHKEDIVELLNYVNTSIESVNYRMEVLSLGLVNVNIIVTDSIANINKLSSNLTLARRDFAYSLQVATTEMHDTLRDIQYNISMNAESAKNLTFELERNFERNLSMLEMEIFSSIEQLNIKTLRVTVQLNSSVSQLYLNISQQRADLMNTVHLAEAALSTALGNLSTETDERFEQLGSSVSRNFSSVNMQLDALSENTSSAYSGLSQDLEAQRVMVNYSLDALGFSLNQLSSSVDRLGSNLSSVSSEVGQVRENFDNFTSSPLSLYSGCREEKADCSLGFDTPHYYTGKCTTAFRPMNSTVSEIKFWLS